MSGVMLKTAVYGALRVTFDLLGEPQWWWGVVAISVGLFSALYGVVFAATQTDMKRLLAYSSIENLGIIFTGFGLAIVFRGAGMPGLTALALIAVLYHCLNHAFMKSLLFVGTGAVLHSTGERNLGRLGGLIHRMPWVAWLTLIGTLALAGLPPLNGFVSEWLLLQAFLFAHEVPHTFVNMLLPMGAALVALAAALAAYVMVKFYGVIFLGQPREAGLARAQDAGISSGSDFFGLRSVVWRSGYFQPKSSAIYALSSESLLLSTCPTRRRPGGARAPARTAGVVFCSRFLVALTAVALLAIVGVRLFYHQRVRRSPAWDCGFARLDARMQDTAEGFGQPIRHIFEPFFAVKRELPSPFDRAPRYRRDQRPDLAERLYLSPWVPLVQRVADAFAWLQQGRITTYLLYSFVTLVVLLALVAMRPIGTTRSHSSSSQPSLSRRDLYRLDQPVSRLAAEP